MKNLMYAAIAFAAFAVGAAALGIGYSTHSLATSYLSGSISISHSGSITLDEGGSSFRIRCSGCN